MKILSVHNEYLIKGGEDESRRAEAGVLREHGHTVTDYIEHNRRVQVLHPVQLALRTVWSRESYRHVRTVLRQQPHDVVHVQNFFPLISPSVYYAAKAEGVPVVQAVRNYRFLCTSALMYRNGQVCDLCIRQKSPLPGIRNRCYRNSLGASCTAAAMLLTHNLMDTWNQVDVFVAVSQFVKDQMVAGGFPAHKICVKPNFVFPDPGPTFGARQNFLLFVGRLSPEKGIDVLLKAVSLLKNKSLKLKIIGEGPLEDCVQQAAARGEVGYLGKKTLAETYAIMGQARALVVPSSWHEPFGRVVVEAYAKGTPVIGARAGGIGELIDEGRTGYGFTPGNAAELAACIDRLMAAGESIDEMGRAARERYDQHYTASANYAMLRDIYQRAGALRAVAQPPLPV